MKIQSTKATRDFMPRYLFVKSMIYNVWYETKYWRPGYLKDPVEIYLRSRNSKPIVPRDGESWFRNHDWNSLSGDFCEELMSFHLGTMVLWACTDRPPSEFWKHAHRRYVRRVPTTWRHAIGFWHRVKTRGHRRSDSHLHSMPKNKRNESNGMKCCVKMYHFH
jgi:hypothetical protein